MDLHISKRLKDLLPPLSEQESKQLRENIEADGEILEPILYWNDGKKNVVVDGMNRFAIARKGNLAYPSKSMHFESYEEVELWILNHQLGRRNVLDPAAIRKIRGEMYNRLKGRQGGDHTSQKAKCQNDTLLGDAAAEVAEKAGVSASTVKRDGARVKAIEGLSKAAKAIADKASDAEVKKLAKLPTATQNAVAHAVRVGQAKTVAEAIRKTGKDDDSTGKSQESTSRSPRNGTDQPAALDPEAEHKQAVFQAKGCLKQWTETIRHMMSDAVSIDSFRESFPGPLGDKTIEAAKGLYEALEAWRKAIK